jgi:hypothetical protein
MADLVAPIHPDYPYHNVGLRLFVGKMGTCKTNDVLKHLMMADSYELNGFTFYSKKVYSGSVGKMVKLIPYSKKH